MPTLTPTPTQVPPYSKLALDSQLHRGNQKEKPDKESKIARVEAWALQVRTASMQAVSF